VLAWWFWLAAHVFFLIGFRNRLIVLINWAWAYWSYQRGARIILGEDHEDQSHPRGGEHTEAGGERKGATDRSQRIGQIQRLGEVVARVVANRNVHVQVEIPLRPSMDVEVGFGQNQTASHPFPFSKGKPSFSDGVQPGIFDFRSQDLHQGIKIGKQFSAFFATDVFCDDVDDLSQGSAPDERFQERHRRKRWNKKE